MIFQYSKNIWDIFACPLCADALNKSDEGATCLSCQTIYEYAEHGSLDLRLKKEKQLTIEFSLPPVSPPPECDYRPLAENITPAVDFSGIRLPHHLTKELMSYFPRASSIDSLALDIGCGSAIHKGACEYAGFEYIGLDYNSLQAPILGDAHSLPFKDNSFEFIISIAVLEHIRFPFVMMREAYRVLKPGGTFIGTVAFLEPFHDNSFYHHTHLGTLNSLQHGGFVVKFIAPSEDWPVLIAQACMGLWPMMPSLLSKSLVMPLQLLHKVWWRLLSLRLPDRNNIKRIRNTTGAFEFIAVKE